MEADVGDEAQLSGAALQRLWSPSGHASMSAISQEAGICSAAIAVILVPAGSSTRGGSKNPSGSVGQPSESTMDFNNQATSPAREASDCLRQRRGLDRTKPPGVPVERLGPSLAGGAPASNGLGKSDDSFTGPRS